MGTWFIEVDIIQSLDVPFHGRHLSLLLGLNVVQCTERRHQESGLIIIISLRQMSLILHLPLVILALLCLMAHLPTAPVGVGVDLLILLVQRSLAMALTIATVARGGFPRVPLGSTLLLYQQQLTIVRCCCGLLHALVHRP